MRLTPTFSEMSENPNLLERAKVDCIQAYDEADNTQKGVILRSIVEVFADMRTASYRNIDGGKRKDWIELAAATAVAEHAGFDLNRAVNSEVKLRETQNREAEIAECAWRIAHNRSWKGGDWEVQQRMDKEVKDAEKRLSELTDNPQQYIDAAVAEEKRRTQSFLRCLS